MTVALAVKQYLERSFAPIGSDPADPPLLTGGFSRRKPASERKGREKRPTAGTRPKVLLHFTSWPERGTRKKACGPHGSGKNKQRIGIPGPNGSKAGGYLDPPWLRAAPEL